MSGWLSQGRCVPPARVDEPHTIGPAPLRAMGDGTKAVGDLLLRRISDCCPPLTVNSRLGRAGTPFAVGFLA